MDILSKKQKFFKPAISKQETRKLYERASEQYNNQFYDEFGKFINKGSKKLTFKHKEIFMSVVALMDYRLKMYNFSNKYPSERNFISNPFQFSLSVRDIINMSMQNEENKRTADDKSIKRYMYRLKKADIFKTFQWRKSKMRYDVMINPKITAFHETFTEKSTTLKSDVKNSKRTDCPFYTVYKTTLINNNKTNRTDFNRMENLHVNFSLLKIDLKKNRGDGNPAPAVIDDTQIDLIISENKFEKIIDNRPLSTKKNEKEQTAGEIFEASKTADEAINEQIRNNINKMLYPVRKTPSFSPIEQKKDHDFYNFKKNTVVAFYVFLLNVLFPDKSKSYSPRDFDSPYRIYVLQSIQELVTNPKYFGKCRSIRHFEYQRQFLQNVVMNIKNKWMKSHPDFNFNHVAPNRYLSGDYNYLKFEKAVDFFYNKQQQKKEHITAKKTISQKQFESAIKIVEKLINIKANFGLHMTKEFQSHCRVYMDKESRMRIRSEQNSDNYRFLQFFIKNYNIDYKLTKIN